MADMVDQTLITAPHVPTLDLTLSVSFIELHMSFTLTQAHVTALVQADVQ